MTGSKNYLFISIILKNKLDYYFSWKNFFATSEVLGKIPDFTQENIELITTVGIVGFFIGTVLKINETKENFSRNNQLTIYTNKKMATVLITKFSLWKLQNYLYLILL